MKSATTTPTATSSIIKSESIILLTLALNHKDYMFHLVKNREYQIYLILMFQINNSKD